MPLRSILTPLIACFLLALTAASSPAAQEVSRVVAVVGEDVITSLDVDKLYNSMQAQLAAAMAERPGQEAPSPSEMRHMALERLIEDKIFEQEVKRANISVANPEVDHYIERIKKMNNISDNEFAAQLSRRGVTPEDYRAELKRDLLKQKLVERSVKSRVVISDKEVDDFFKTHSSPSSSASASQVRLRALFLSLGENPTPASEGAVAKRAQELHQKVASGESFTDLARRFSQGPGAQQGGELGPVAIGDLLPEMRQALAGLKPGQISPVIKVPGAYVFMQLLDSDARPQSAQPTPEMRERIRSKLENEALEKRFKEWLKELRSKSYVKVMEP